MPEHIVVGHRRKTGKFDAKNFEAFTAKTVPGPLQPTKSTPVLELNAKPAADAQSPFMEAFRNLATTGSLAASIGMVD